MKQGRAISSLFKTAAPVLALACLVAAALPARADTGVTSTPARGLQEALASNDRAHIYNDPGRGGFSLAGNFFSGRASGADPVATGFFNDAGNGGDFSLDRTAELEGEQRVYALLIDGTYDFNYDFGSGLPLRPYLLGGVGMAMYGGNAGTGGLSMQSGDMVPLFRVGGGVTYRLGEKWKLSLDYKAGFSGGGDQIFTGRGQQPVDLQTLNMGMHFEF